MREKRQQPQVVIGSSWESRPLAEALQESLLYVAEVTIRHQGFYPLSGDSADDLRRDLGGADFAVFLMSAEDVTLMRDENQAVIRDNLLLQLGMALGILGRKRVFYVSPRSLPRDAPELHVPADALGVVAAAYSPNFRGDDLAAVLGTVCAGINREISLLGRRLPALSPDISRGTPGGRNENGSDVPSSAPAPAPKNAAPAPVKALAPARPPVRIRFDLNHKGPETSQGDQMQLLKTWWDGLPERERRTIIRFHEVDQRLTLRSGMARTCLLAIAEESGYCPDYEDELLVIFHPTVPAPATAPSPSPPPVPPP